MKTPIIIGGQKIGRLRASFLLFKESWRFLRADKELLLVPIFAAFMSFVLIGLFTFVVSLSLQSFDQILEPERSFGYPEYLFMFGVYILSAFSLAIAQATTIHIVYVRAHGGNATLGAGISRAFKSWWTLFQWAVITSTVGLVLRIISDRSELIGRIVAGLLGAAWAILTFFAIPIILLEQKKPTTAIKNSAQLFKQTWGETLIANVTLGAFFMLAHIIVLVSFIGLLIYSGSTNNAGLMIMAVVMVVLWLLVSTLLNSALQGILKTLLYIYAAEDVVPENFNKELLESMLVKKGVSKPIVSIAETPVVAQSQANDSVSNF